MKFTPTDPPRTFQVGLEAEITLKDCGRTDLDPEEQITFTLVVTNAGPGPASAVSVVDAFPATLDYVSGSASSKLSAS